MRKLKQFVVFLCLFACLSAHAGQVTGLIQSAGGTPLSNASLTFTPTMFSIVAGSFVQTAASVPCYTDALGNVVGLPNPLVTATAASANSGSLTAATTYYLQFTYWVVATETAPSPELAFFLPGGQSSINITAPALQPTGATGYRVYASTTPGGEKLQQTVTGFGNTSITSLLSVTSVTSSNNTVCSFNFSDSLIPQARYVLRITDSSGSDVPGWPQTYYMQGSTFNLNTAFPTANTTAIFQNAIVSTPSGGVTQSIFGGLNLNGFGITAGLGSFSGVCYTFENGKAVVVVSASCGYTTWTLALAACPSTGCIMDGTAPDVPLALGAFDTGSNTKPVTVNLGPYNFTATQITVRQGLKLRGAGTLSTNITSVGTNAQPLFVNPQVNNNAITIEISGMSLNALSGNTSQDGIFFDCSTLTNAGVELSRFDNLIFNGFKGVPVHFKATQDGASGSIGCTQGNQFSNVTAIRPTGATGATQNALRIEGGAGQFDFWNCWFDGQSSDTGTNVFVGTTGTQAPYSIHFHSTTNQNGFAYLFDGCGQCTTDYDHFEVIKGAYNFLATASPVHFTSTNAYINSNVAVNAGNGYIVNIPNTAPNVDALVDKPFVGGQPDNCVKNASATSTARITNIRVISGNTPVNVCPSNGITGTLTPAATVDLKSWNTIQVSASATSMSTFKSTLMPGETVTLYATGGTIQFATGGNISLGANTSPLVIPSGDSVTFMRVDAGTPAFVLSAYSRGTNALINTVATGTGSGNSITLLNSQDTLGNVTGTGGDNTLYTFTIPANTIQAGKGFRIRMHAISNNAVSCAYKLTVGSTTVSLGSSTGNSNVDFQVEVLNNSGVQTAQRGMGFGFEGTVAIIFNTTFTMAENFANALAVKITANEANPNTVTPDKWFMEIIQ